MSKITNIEITQDQLDNMRIIKYNINNKPKVWVKDGILYKLDENDVIKAHKEDFEILSLCPDLENCVFPDKTFTINGKYIGYTTPYFEDYKSICFRMNKNKYSINQKKKLMKKLVKLLIKLNDNDVVHADLNTSNIISNGKNIKLVDFDRIKIKDYTYGPTYKWRLNEQINYLNIALLSILFDANMISIMESEYKQLIDEMTFSSEFKQYLLNCLFSKEEEISKELLDYIDSIKKFDIVKGKELVKTLQL